MRRRWKEKLHGNQMVKMHICRLLTPTETWTWKRILLSEKKRYVKRRREIGRQKEDEINYLARNVHLDDGVRRMSFFTGLLLFFSHSFTSLHDDWRFEKTILDDDASFTDGINNITFNSLIIIYFFTIIVWYQFSFDNLFFSLRFWLITQFLNVTLLAFIKFILIKLRIFK